MGINSRKVVVVGCGFVGSSSAFALMQTNSTACSEHISLMTALKVWAAS